MCCKMRDDSSPSESRSTTATPVSAGEGDEGPPPTKTPAPSPFVYPPYEGQEDEDTAPDEDEDEDEDGEEEGNLLEIMIETLTGTSFQVRVSPWETAGGLKDLLHRTQGIPSCHQHILLGQRELLDESPLIDQGVQDGTSLKLILSMKGGPINSLRIPTQEDAIWKDFNSYMEMNKEELWEGGNSGRQVTLLVLREGDDVNIYRVVENADGTFSPLNESWGSNSLMSGKTDSSSDKESRFQDEAKMHQRISDLRSQMEALNLKKKEKKKRKKVVVGKVSAKATKLFSPKRGKTNQKSSKTTLSNLPKKLFCDLSEETPRDIESSKTDRPQMRAKLTSSHSRIVPPLRRLPSTNFSSPRSSLQFSHRSDLTSRPPSQMMAGHPTTPLDSARLSMTRRSSRPSTQERGLEPRRGSLSRGVVLDEISHSFAPIQVDFSRHKRLEAIRAQRERNNNLGPLTEDNNGNSSASNGANGSSYRKSLVRHSRISDTDPLKDENSYSNEPWRRSGVPVPFYMDHPRPRKKTRSRRLYQSFNSDFLKFPTEFDDRPKTSPEVLAAKRPGTGSTNSTMSDRIQLRGADEKLKEIINILNGSRTSSRTSFQSLETSSSSLRKKWQSSLNHSIDKPHIQPDKASLSMSLTSFRASPPLNPPSPRSGVPFPSDASSREALKELVRAQGIGVRPSSRKSTPDTYRKGTKKTPGSRNSTPGKFPPLTPKKKAKRLHKPHCRQCRRKLGISNTYSCRCGHVYCATHRYSETHDCTFDYKAAGRKFLEMTNPIVVPPKLPKI